MFVGLFRPKLIVHEIEMTPNNVDAGTILLFGS